MGNFPRERLYMINCLIFSKDRACQLDLLLRSIKDNFKELKNIGIIYKYSNNNFKIGYEKIIQLYSDINWIEETNFFNNFKNYINNIKEKYTLILVDDEVVIRNFNIEGFLNFLNLDSNLHCISLRMHSKLNYSYASKIYSPPPSFFETYHSINSDQIAYSWNWNHYLIDSGTEYSDWSYPSCINTHIYTTIFLKNILTEIYFNNPNILEASIHQLKNYFKEKILFFEKAKTISIPNNLTQTVFKNICGNKEEYSLESLNEKYINNYEINTKNLYNLDVNSCHYEIDYLLEEHKI